VALGLPAVLLDPQATSSSAAIDVSALLNPNRWKRTPSTSAPAHRRWTEL